MLQLHKLKQAFLFLFISLCFLMGLASCFHSVEKTSPEYKELTHIHLPIDSIDSNSYIGHKVYFDGVDHILIQNNEIIMNRYSARNLDDITESYYPGAPVFARGQVGVKIRLKTNSRNVRFRVSQRRDGLDIPLDDLRLVVFENGVLSQSYTSKLDIQYEVKLKADTNLIELYLPSLYGINLKNIQIDSGSSTFTHQASDSTLVIIGDSNAAGYANIQATNNQLWGDYLSRLKGWNLYNLGLVGSQVSMLMTHSLAFKKIDQVLIMYGTNSYHMQMELAKFRLLYAELLESINEYQPTSEIICITPIAFNLNIQERHIDPIDYTLEDYRIIIREECEKMNQASVFEGGQLINIHKLADDQVHISPSLHDDFAQWINGQMAK